MATAPTDLAATFTLSVIANQLEGLQLPTGDFDPNGDWEQSYAVVQVGQVSSTRGGRIRLRRQHRGGLFNFEYDKPVAGGGVHRQTAEIHCERDTLATPQRWELQWGTRAADGKAVFGTGYDKSGQVNNGIIRVADHVSERKLPKPAAFTINWLLFDVVQRLPRESFEPIRFTLLDDFDQPKPDVTLSYWKPAEVMLGGKRVQKQEWEQLERGRARKTFWGRDGDRPVRLTAYSLLGHGTVPWAFWVDQQGRLLFASAGLEAYILEAREGV